MWKILFLESEWEPDRPETQVSWFSDCVWFFPKPLGNRLLSRTEALSLEKTDPGYRHCYFFRIFLLSVAVLTHLSDLSPQDLAIKQLHSVFIPDFLEKCSYLGREFCLSTWWYSVQCTLVPSGAKGLGESKHPRAADGLTGPELRTFQTSCSCRLSVTELRKGRL